MNNGIIDARNLAYYISERYFDFTNHTSKITNIKLQKTLYFLFAMWGGFVEKSKSQSHQEFATTLSSILFDNTIQAWVYGPVVPDVFFENRDGDLSEYKFEISEFFSGEKEMLKETLDSIMDNIFKISDFKLVSISHDDLCWKSHFNPNDDEHHEEIPKMEIIREYASR